MVKHFKNILEMIEDILFILIALLVILVIGTTFFVFTFSYVILVTFINIVDKIIFYLKKND